MVRVVEALGVLALVVVVVGPVLVVLLLILLVAVVVVVGLLEVVIILLDELDDIEEVLLLLVVEGFVDKVDEDDVVARWIELDGKAVVEVVTVELVVVDYSGFNSSMPSQIQW